MALTSARKRTVPKAEQVRRGSEASDELKFISELGRSLLFMVHPKKVAARVAVALRQRLDAEACVFLAELENIGVVSFGVDRRGELLTSFFHRPRFERWLELLPPQVGHPESDRSEFMIDAIEHEVEYVSPLHINGKVKGLIAVGFNETADFDDVKANLIEAATRMAAMSINLSAHYEAAINSSITRAREEHRRFTEAILDSLPVSIYVIDRDYRIVTWNRQREVGLQGIPRDEAIGRNVFNVLARYPEGQVRQEFEDVFRIGEIQRIEQQTTAEDGSTKHWMVSKIPMRNPDTGDVTHVITVGEDVTMRVEAIHAVGRAEKLAAVGRLAAGVVHEINNPLATIAACAEALEQRAEEGSFAGSDALDDLHEYLELIKSEAFRCKSITTGLLDFSRMRTGERSPIDLAEILRSSVNLISHQRRGENITIDLDIEDGLPPVNADGGQIQQAVIALATNAIDAMPEGGTLRFKAFAGNRRVSVEISDTGVGIPAENMSKIFEPFFTTKDVGKGTGLGLAVCYGIITDHGGRLSVRSNVGKGTTFTIALPVVKHLY